VSDWGKTDTEVKSTNELISELNKHKKDIQKHSADLQEEVSKLIKSNPFNKK
jgi:hypothetical protein